MKELDLFAALRQASSRILHLRTLVQKSFNPVAEDSMLLATL